MIIAIKMSIGLSQSSIIEYARSSQRLLEMFKMNTVATFQKEMLVGSTEYRGVSEYENEVYTLAMNLSGEPFGCKVKTIDFSPVIMSYRLMIDDKMPVYLTNGCRVMLASGELVPVSEVHERVTKGDEVVIAFIQCGQSKEMIVRQLTHAKVTKSEEDYTKTHFTLELDLGLPPDSGLVVNGLLIQ
jgi:hypothetical protein